MPAGSNACHRIQPDSFISAGGRRNLVAGISEQRRGKGLHFAYYNFCRVHRSLRVTPAMEAGITDRIWGLKDLLA
jgi:hypothetical protein